MSWNLTKSETLVATLSQKETEHHYRIQGDPSGSPQEFLGGQIDLYIHHQARHARADG